MAPFNRMPTFLRKLANGGICAGKLLLFFQVCPLFAILIGNPAQPAMQKEGIVRPASWWSVRIAYFEDYVYRQRFEDEFIDPELFHSKTFSRMTTDAGLITLNFWDRLDLYGILGGSRLQLDKELFTTRQFAWGTGLKWMMYQKGNFRLGADFKYFETDQKPTYFLSDGLPYSVVSNFTLQYHEIQGALGISYRAGPFIPYVYGTYLITKIRPVPASVAVRLPFAGPDGEIESVDLLMKSIVGEKQWGVTVGATILDGEKASLSVESRLYNQNSIDVNLEVRF